MAIVFVDAKIVGGMNGYVPTYGDGHQGVQLGKLANGTDIRIPALISIPDADMKKWYSFTDDAKTKPWYVRTYLVPETWVEFSHVQVSAPVPVKITDAQLLGAVKLIIQYIKQG